MSPARPLLFGSDLALREQATGLDLHLDAAGDLMLAQGNANIVQALTMRLKVRRGELAVLGWPAYGSRLHELIGQPNNPRTRTLLMGRAREALLADARVADIPKIEARALPGERDLVRLEITVLLVAEQNPLNLVYDLRLRTE